MQEVCARYPSPKTSLLWAVVVASAAVSGSLITGCFSGATFGSNNAATISASSNTVRVSQQLQLSADAGVGSLNYFVNGIAGGNDEVGTVSSSGLYTAPPVIPSPDSVVVTSVSKSFPNAPKGSVTLTIWNPIPILSGVTPSGFSEGTTTVTVAGSRFVYGAQISWNGVPVQTAYISDTQLAAVIDAPIPGTYPLNVTNPNPGSASASPLSLKVGPGQVVLQLFPNTGSDVRVNNQISFGLTVNGTDNPGVTLQVNGVPGGNATVGTAVSNSTQGTIIYTAPAVVPAPSNVVQMTITSVDNPKVSIEQDISVMNPIPILGSVTPDSFNPGPATVVLHGQKFITGAQVLVNGTAIPATFNNSTQLTANLDVTEPGNVDLQVLNPAPGPAASSDVLAVVNGTPPVPVVDTADAARFLEQATFGATDPDIHQLSMMGYQAWLNQQFAIPATPQVPLVQQELMLNNPPCASNDLKCNTALFLQNSNDEQFVQNAFWQQAITGNDELRERVRYALSEMLVVSSNNSSGVQNYPRGEANFEDMLGADAFKNFRTILNDVTLNPEMGIFLSMLGNDKGNATTDPDENYAREVMQLFTIGLYQLNDDGTQKLDGNGNPIPTYSNNDVMGLAKVFTGFSWQIPGNGSDAGWSNCCAYVGPGYGEDLLPMVSYTSHHSTDEKQFLGATIPAGSSNADADLKFALDTIFNHPNVPAFVSKQLIEHLITSNPSPGYIGRVAAVFKDDGTGVRGNMQAVITAILLDPEARDTAVYSGNPQYGKVREALLRYTEWARAFTAQSRTGSFDIQSTEDPIYGLGEMPLRSPTVFWWFSPQYVPPGTNLASSNLLAPEMQMTNVSTVVGYINYMEDAIGGNSSSGPDLFASYGAEIGLAATPDQLIYRLNLLLMAGEMSSSLQSQVLAAVNAIPIPTGDQSATYAAETSRVQTAIFLITASPDFSAQF
jgi:uncharacterized protein (DUF1800 family)